MMPVVAPGSSQFVVELVDTLFRVERGPIGPRYCFEDSVEEVVYGLFAVVGVYPVEIQVL